MKHPAIPSYLSNNYYWGEPKRAHTNRHFEQIAVLMYVSIYVAIRRPRVRHAHARTHVHSAHTVHAVTTITG